jgi:hypothetical protein
MSATLTRIANCALAIVVLAPIVIITLTQAAQIVA